MSQPVELVLHICCSMHGTTLPNEIQHCSKCVCRNQAGPNQTSQLLQSVAAMGAQPICPCPIRMSKSEAWFCSVQGASICSALTVTYSYMKACTIAQAVRHQQSSRILMEKMRRMPWQSADQPSTLHTNPRTPEPPFLFRHCGMYWGVLCFVVTHDTFC